MRSGVTVPVLAGLATLAGLMCAGQPRAATPGAGVSGGGAGELAYVCNQDDATVSVIDMDANVIIQTVDLTDLGFTPTAKPHHTAVEPDGSHWYLSLIGDNHVLKFNRRNELVGRVEFERPGMLAMHPTADLLLVGRSMAAVNPPQRIGVIRRSDMTIEELDVFFPRPHAIAVNPRTGYVYSASLAVNQIGSVNIDSEELELTTLADPGHPHVLVQFAISPNGERMVVGGEMTGKFMVFDVTRPPALPRLHLLDVNAAPWHPAFTPDGRWVYVPNKRANTVTVIDAQTWQVAKVIDGEGLAEPHGIAVSPDGKRVYVSSNNLKGEYRSRRAPSEGDNPGTVVVINTATQAIEKIIEVGHNATGMSTRAAR